MTDNDAQSLKEMCALFHKKALIDMILYLVQTYLTEEERQIILATVCKAHSARWAKLLG